MLPDRSTSEQMAGFDRAVHELDAEELIQLRYRYRLEMEELAKKEMLISALLDWRERFPKEVPDAS